MTGDLLSSGGSLSSKQLQRMVTALDLASDNNAEITALEAELLQAKSKALLYEVQYTQHIYIYIYIYIYIRYSDSLRGYC